VQAPWFPFRKEITLLILSVIAPAKLHRL